MGVSDRFPHQLPSGFCVSRMRTRCAYLRMFLLSRSMGTFRISLFSQKRMGRLPLARRNSIALAVFILIIVAMRRLVAQKRYGGARGDTKQCPKGLWVQTFPQAQAPILIQNGQSCQ